MTLQSVLENSRPLSASSAWEILEFHGQRSLHNEAFIAARLLNAPIGFVVLTTRDGYLAEGLFGLEPVDIPPILSLCERLLIGRYEPVFFQDLGGAEIVMPSISFFAAAPILQEDGVPVGWLCVMDPHHRDVAATDLDSLQALASALANTILSRRHLATLRQAAFYDRPTGLKNRAAFECYLDGLIHSVRQSADFAPVCATMSLSCLSETDREPVSVTKLLKSLAQHVMAVIPGAMITARTGANDISVVLKKPFVHTENDTLTASLTDAIRYAVMCCPGQKIAELSLGITTFPDDGRTAAGMLSNAIDRRQIIDLHDAGPLVVPQSNAEHARAEHHALERDLYAAIEKGEFYLNWQPMVDAASRQPLGYEAFLRWDRPGYGLVPPSRFLPLARAKGLIGAIDAWVLKTACLEASRWSERSLRAAISISSTHLLAENMPSLLVSALHETGLIAQRLEIQIAEPILATADDVIFGNLQYLRELGVRVAIKNFGTGLAHAAYRQMMPLDKLKLDRSFVRDLFEDPEAEDAARTLVRLGHRLGVIAAAEGVETEAQLTFLQSIGFEELQGYLLGWPRSVA